METLNKYSRNHVFSKDGALLPIEQRTFTTNEGYECIIIDGGTRKGYNTAKIHDYILEDQTTNIHKGSTKYPLHKSVVGVGYLGIGTFTPKVHRWLYVMWKHMLERSYDPKYHETRPTYTNVTVCDEWHNFQTFSLWVTIESNYTEGWHLDKDLLDKSAKHYSPNTCVFIPPNLNNFFTNELGTNTSGCPGVRQVKNGNWTSKIKDVVLNKTKTLGTFKVKEEAIKVYRQERANQAQVWKDRMQGILPIHAINAIK